MTKTKKIIAKVLKVTLKATKALASVVKVVSAIGIVVLLLFVLLVFSDDFSIRELFIWKGYAILISIALWLIIGLADKVAEKSAYMLGEEQ